MTVMACSASEAPHPDAAGDPGKIHVGFGDVINLALSESFQASVWRDLFAAEAGRVDDIKAARRHRATARHHDRRAAIFDAVATVFIRIERDHLLKQRLHELAAEAAADRGVTEDSSDGKDAS